MTDQEKEIATIRERTLKIRLSDADILRVCEKAGVHNITVAHIVESYLMDLVNGTYTSGSDERHRANAYFERCNYGTFPGNTFLRYLITTGGIGEYIENLDAVRDYENELTRYAVMKNLTNGEKASFEIFQEELKLAKAVLVDYYKEYCSRCTNEPPEPPDKAQAAVIAWQTEYKNLKGEPKQ